MFWSDEIRASACYGVKRRNGDGINYIELKPINYANLSSFYTVADFVYYCFDGTDTYDLSYIGFCKFYTGFCYFIKGYFFYYSWTFNLTYDLFF